VLVNQSVGERGDNGLGTRSPVLALGMLVFRHRQPLSAAGVTDWLAPGGTGATKSPTVDRQLEPRRCGVELLAPVGKLGRAINENRERRATGLICAGGSSEHLWIFRGVGNGYFSLRAHLFRLLTFRREISQPDSTDDA
jgi:hypothetical protein